MYTFRHAGRHASETARHWWWPWVLLAAAWPTTNAFASCLPDADPRVLRLQNLIVQDANQALRQAQNELLNLQREPSAQEQPNGLLAASRIAALYAVKAEAYGILEFDAEARSSAEKGLALVPNPRDPVHLELLLAYTDNVYDDARHRRRHSNRSSRRALLQPAGSPADTCLLISRGLLEHRQGREDLAIVTLTQAYRASSAPRSHRSAHHGGGLRCRWSCAAWATTARRSRSIRRRSTGTRPTMPPWGFRFRDSCVDRSSS